MAVIHPSSNIIVKFVTETLVVGSPETAGRHLEEVEKVSRRCKDNNRELNLSKTKMVVVFRGYMQSGHYTPQDSGDYCGESQQLQAQIRGLDTDKSHFDLGKRDQAALVFPQTAEDVHHLHSAATSLLHLGHGERRSLGESRLHKALHRTIGCTALTCKTA